MPLDRISFVDPVRATIRERSSRIMALISFAASIRRRLRAVRSTPLHLPLAGTLLARYPAAGAYIRLA